MMTVTADHAENHLAEQLTALVAAQPEVLRVYSAHSTPSDLISQTFSAIIPTPTRPPVRVSETANGTTITILIGVTGERSVTAICHDIYTDVTKEAVAEGATAPITIAITIASID